VKRIVAKLLVFLLLGAIVNVAVAWGFALKPWSNIQSLERDTKSGVPQTFIHVARGKLYLSQNNGWISIFYAAGHAPIEMSEREYQAVIPWWSAFRNAEPAQQASSSQGQDAFTTYTERAFGWPMLGLHSTSITYERYAPNEYVVDSDAIRFSDEITKWLYQNDIGSELPLRPIWPGFAINTLFYAAILWLLFAGPGRVRRWRRSKRGLCVKCAYPVGTSDVCTECGAQINKKIHARGSMGLPPPATPA
jgi:hypothetical protein